MRYVCSVVAASLISGAASAHHCPIGDLDLDGVVGIVDFLTLLGDWGPCPGPPLPCHSDLDGDGMVGVVDFLMLLGNWGPQDLDGGQFPGMWINGGPNCPNEPVLQVHQFNDDTYILRQSLCTNFEGPFLYLLFGADEAMLFDTGTVGISLAPTVYAIIDDWLAAHNRESISLLVAHSHGHSDHIGNTGEFNGQPDTTVVLPMNAEAFFGFADWPNDVVQYDLGGRVLDVLAIPGHAPNHLAIYDRQTGLMLAGDSIMPGRLLIFDFPAYLDSIQRVVDFAGRNTVCEFLGGHIEMSNTPGDDYAPAATYHPDEHPLPLHMEHLLEIQQGVIDMQDDPVVEVHDEFIIAPVG